MSIWRNRKAHYQQAKEIVESGGINCIPFPFERFRNVFPGIQQGKYYGITGVQKSSKSQLSLYLFTLHPLLYAFLNPDKIKVKVLYFSLEMGVNQLWDRIIGWWLYQCYNIKASTSQLNSLNANYPLESIVLDKMTDPQFTQFLDYVEENMVIYEHIRNPVGIYKECINLSHQSGTMTYKEVDWMDNITNNIVKKKVIDTYVPNDPNQYNILVVDHLSLLTPEKAFGGDKTSLYGTIGKFSSNDCVYLRNVYNWTICAVQQQSLKNVNFIL